MFPAEVCDSYALAKCHPFLVKVVDVQKCDRITPTQSPGFFSRTKTKSSNFRFSRDKPPGLILKLNLKSQISNLNSRQRLNQMPKQVKPEWVEPKKTKKKLLPTLNKH
jgi:hypothetical protein